ncbi:acyl carrier protein [Streptomyces triticagri]|uniref:Acyl carrier protein n=1 Tax=Streptomyces triticagri TaxID=2293568 RepID=A0A372M1J8_9ACTN|nr:acyl carrier protein [Streptomyces triticagri]RFU84709.1 acyl carrier protein [Streptomyces triticagri]
MHSEPETLQQVVEVMQQLGFGESDLTELTEETRIAEDLGIDSTELVEIVVALERRFSISIDADAEDAVVTFGDLVDRVVRLRHDATRAVAAAVKG